MSHLTEQQLHAWLDGEPDAVMARDEVAAHVKACAHCAALVDDVRRLSIALGLWASERCPVAEGDLGLAVIEEKLLGDGVRMWASERAPDAKGDLVERVVLEDRLLRSGVALWAEASAPEPVDDLAGWIFAKAGDASGERLAPVASPAVSQPAPDASAREAPQSATAAPPATPSNVVPLRPRRSILLAAPLALAAAAAAVFMLTRSPTRPTAPRPGTEIARTNVPARDTNPGAGNTPAPQAPSQPEPGPTQVASAEDPGGSEVLAVDADGEHTTYSVVEVPGMREGTTVAVVWIEDSAGKDGSAVQ